MENVSFSPYDYAVELGAVEFLSGVNWTWVTFTDQVIRLKFDDECRRNGFRVRDYGKCKTQFHHYRTVKGWGENEV